MTLSRPPATPEQIADARAICKLLDDGCTVEVDDDALTSVSPEGVWVQAWVFVPTIDVTTL